MPCPINCETVFIHTDAHYIDEHEEEEKVGCGCASGIARNSEGVFLFGFIMKLGKDLDLKNLGGSAKSEAIAIWKSQDILREWRDWNEKSGKELNVRA